MRALEWERTWADRRGDVNDRTSEDKANRYLNIVCRLMRCNKPEVWPIRDRGVRQTWQGECNSIPPRSMPSRHEEFIEEGTKRQGRHTERGTGRALDMTGHGRSDRVHETGKIRGTEPTDRTGQTV